MVSPQGSETMRHWAPSAPQIIGEAATSNSVIHVRVFQDIVPALLKPPRRPVVGKFIGRFTFEANTVRCLGLEFVAKVLACETSAINAIRGESRGETALWLVPGHKIEIPAKKRVAWVTYRAHDVFVWGNQTEHLRNTVDLSDHSN